MVNKHGELDVNQERIVGGMGTAKLVNSTELLSIGIEANHNFSFLDENKRTVYLSFIKDGIYYTASAKYINTPSPIRDDHPQDMFLIKNADVKITTMGEKGEDIEARRGLFNNSDIVSIANGMKSYIYRTIRKH